MQWKHLNKLIGPIKNIFVTEDTLITNANKHTELGNENPALYLTNCEYILYNSAPVSIDIIGV